MEENKINTNSSNNTTTTTENKLTLDDVLKGYRDDSAEKTIKRNEARDVVNCIQISIFVLSVTIGINTQSKACRCELHSN